MEKIIIKEEKKARIIRIVGAILGVFLILLGIKTKGRRELLIGAIFLYVTFYKTEVIITKEGVVYKRRGIFLKRDEEVSFSDVEKVIVYKSRDGKYVFYLEMENLPKGFKVKESYVEPIANLIESREEKLPIEYVVDEQ